MALKPSSEPHIGTAYMATSPAKHDEESLQLLGANVVDDDANCDETTRCCGHLTLCTLILNLLHVRSCVSEDRLHCTGNNHAFPFRVVMWHCRRLGDVSLHVQPIRPTPPSCTSMPPGSKTLAIPYAGRTGVGHANGAYVLVTCPPLSLM